MQLTTAARTGALEADAGSWRARARARRKALEADREQTWTLPGYEGVLEVTYRRLRTEDVHAVLSSVEIPSMNERYAQFLIDATVGIYGLEPDGTRTPLEHGRPLGWDEIARAANPDTTAPSLRAAVLEVFDALEGNNDHDLREHGDEVYRWTKRLNAAAAEVVAGE